MAYTFDFAISFAKNAELAQGNLPRFLKNKGLLYFMTTRSWQYFGQF